MTKDITIPKNAKEICQRTGADLALAVAPSCFQQKERFLDQVKVFLDAFTLHQNLRKDTLLINIVSANEAKYGKMTGWLRYFNAIRVDDAGGWEYDMRWVAHVGEKVMKEQYGMV